MRFRMLGPVRVRGRAGWQPVPATQQRLLLAALLIDAGRIVTTERLVYEVWGDQPPRTAHKTIQAYVMRLRRLIDDRSASLLRTRDRGYELAIADGDLDAWRYERLVEAGRAALAGGQPEPAAAQLSEALALWQGPVLADVPEAPGRAARVAQLEQSRLAVIEDHLTALLELGRPAEAVEPLLRLVEEHPLREGLWALLMQAQRAGGRRAEALVTYQRARTVLRDELGLEPGPALLRLQREILTDQPPPAAARPTTVVPAQLPADVGGFTGRTRQLKELDGLLPHPGRAVPTAVAVAAISGTAGVGKTTLAVRWAHQVRDRFPDGQLYLDLRGYASGPPVQPTQALARFLHALGVPPEEVPSDPEGASALYRSHLAGKRVLVLLDNAGSAEQVRPLLPGAPDCLALVTSRDRLGGLVARDGAVPLVLPALTGGEAQELLVRMLGAERVHAEPDAVAELARLCGHLPLALRIAAANLATRPQIAVAAYADRLSRDRIGALQVDGDPQWGVRVAFDLSYLALPGEARRLFRLLGLVPGPDVTPPAAAALIDTDPSSAARLLDQLATGHLVDEPTGGRYALHDLLRSYAAERVRAEEPDGTGGPALDRLYDYYLSRVDAAARLACPSVLRLPAAARTESDPPLAARPELDPPFATVADALTWLDDELPNLVAAVRQAAVSGPHPASWWLADALRGYLFLRRPTADWEVVATAARAAGAAADQPSALAAAYLSLGLLETVRDRAEQAIGHNLAAAAQAHRAGWAEAEAAALANTGGQLVHLGRLRDAADYCSRALAMHQQTGWLAGQANQLGNLGMISYRLGRLEQAAEYGHRAAELYRRLDATTEHARAIGALGATYHALGRLAEAGATLTEALSVHRAIGDRLFLGYTLVDLAELGRDRDGGDLAEPRSLADEALGIARDLPDGALESAALAARASIRLRLPDPASAIDDNRRAVELVQAAGDRFSETDVRVRLAGALCAAGQYDAAGETARQALSQAREHGYQLFEGRARAVLASVELGRDDPAGAIAHAEQAASIFAATGHRLGLAESHLIAGDAHHRAGRGVEAGAHRATARSLLAEIGTDLPGVEGDPAGPR